MRQHTTGGSDLEKKIEKLWFHLRTSESPYHVDIFQFSVFLIQSIALEPSNKILL